MKKQLGLDEIVFFADDIKHAKAIEYRLHRTPTCNISEEEAREKWSYFYKLFGDCENWTDLFGKGAVTIVVEKNNLKLTSKYHTNRDIRGLLTLEQFELHELKQSELEQLRKESVNIDEYIYLIKQGE